MKSNGTTEHAYEQRSNKHICSDFHSHRAFWVPYSHSIPKAPCAWNFSKTQAEQVEEGGIGGVTDYAARHHFPFKPEIVSMRREGNGILRNTNEQRPCHILYHVTSLYLLTMYDENEDTGERASKSNP